MVASSSGRRPGPKIPVRSSGEFEPLRFDAVPADQEPEVEYDSPLFYIDGVAYCIPSDPPAYWGLEFIEAAADPGAQVQNRGSIELFERMLTPDGWAALKGYKPLHRDELTVLTRQIITKACGAVEDPKKRG